MADGIVDDHVPHTRTCSACGRAQTREKYTASEQELQKDKTRQRPYM